MVFRPPRAGGQSCSGVALRHPRAVLSSLLLPPLRGCFAFFCARFARRKCPETRAGRGFHGSGLAPVSVLRFACTETGAGSHRAQRESKSRAAVLADCSVLMPMAFTRSSIMLKLNVIYAAVVLRALGEQVRYLRKAACKKQLSTRLGYQPRQWFFNKALRAFFQNASLAGCR